MTVTYAEATTAKTVAAIESSKLADLAAAGVDTAGLSDLSAERGLVALASSSEAKEQEIRVTIAKSVSIDDVSGPWLDVVCKGRYDEERLPALKTKGRPVITAPVGGGTQTIGARTLRADAGGGVFFINTQGVTLAAGASVAIDFECEVAGSIGNVSDGAIAGFQKAPAGLTIINLHDWKTFSGSDAETDKAYRRRCKAKWSTLGAGWTLESFDYLIPKYAPGITRWRVRDDNPRGPGTIEVIAANPTAPATVDELVQLLAGLGARDVMTLGTGGLYAVPATALLVSCVGTLYGDGSNSTLLANARAALAALAKAFDIGGDGSTASLDSSLVHGIIMGGAFPAYGIDGFSGATALTLTSPAADVSFGLDDVLTIDSTGLVLG